MNQRHHRAEKSTCQPFQCGQCSKSYKRPEHLQRHLAVHRGSREHRCVRCGAGFQRSDVLSRHAKTCDGRQSKRPSNARRACDTCIASKRACSLTPPCLNCRRRGLPCTYTLAHTKTPPRPEIMDAGKGQIGNVILETVESTDDISSNDLATMDDDIWSQFFSADLSDLIADDLDWTMLAAGHGNDEGSLRFLESFTRNTGFLDSFDCSTAEDRTLAYTAFTRKLAVSVMPGDDLLLKSHTIVNLIKETVEVKPRNNPVTLIWTPVLETLCMDFFSPYKIHLWLELYFAFWHPNVNYIHRPTFDAWSSKPSLIGAMCIIGALVSPIENDRDSARVWMNSVEEMVFRDDDVCYGGERSTSFPSAQRLQAVQAMYMVCLFQNWEGGESGKSRIRRFRYSTVIAVARDIGITHARHPPYHLLTFSWQEFVAREQLIRVFMWIFLLDTAFVIFNNVPPRMAIKEMNMHLVCSEACFQAPDSELCYQNLQSDFPNKTPTLSALTAMMCKQLVGSMTQQTLADIGPLNLFALVSALHSVIFQTQQVFGLETELTPVRFALDNWSAIWRVYSTSYSTTTKHCPLIHERLCPDNMWRRIGFMRYTSEYWLLAKLIVDRIIEKAQQKEIASTTIISREDEVESAPTILDKYDETSMRQVNALIADFQRIVL